MLIGILTLLLALSLSSLAGYVSVMGMMALFPAGGLTIILMMSALEIGKLIIAGWLHANWGAKDVSRLLLTYFLSAMTVLMVITSLGIFGNLSKSHLEAQSPIAGVELKIDQLQQRIDQTKVDRQRLDDRQKQLDAQVNTLLGVTKNTKDAKATNKIQSAQKAERDQLRRDMSRKDDEINKLSDELMPLKSEISDVTSKLGPVKYVADLFGWKDGDSAVKLIQLMIMFVFDPLAIASILASNISFSRWLRDRAERKAAQTAQTAIVLPPTVPVELPVTLTKSGPNSINADPDNGPILPVADKVKEEVEAMPIEQASPAELVRLAEPSSIDEPLPPAEVENSQPAAQAASPILGSTVIGPVVLPAGTRITMPMYESDFGGSTLPFTASLQTDTNWLANQVPTFGGFTARADKEQLIEILERRPDLLQDFVDTIQESLPAASNVPVEEKKPVEPSDPSNQSAGRMWLNEPWGFKS